MKQLTDIMSRLRSEQGCPWDREQNLESLKECLVEECYEVIDAIDSGDHVRHKEELGDLLLQVLFQAQIRKEEGKFTFDDIAASLAEKLIRRHPHVFGGGRADTPRQVLKQWEEIKSRETPGAETPRSVLDGIPRRLPALLKAQRIQARAARVGFDWTDVKDVVAKIEEECAEVKQALAENDQDRLREELGDLLFAVVNLARFKKVNSEESLDEAVGRFARRFRELEERVRLEGRKLTDCTLAEMDVHWEEIKKAEENPPS